MRGHMRGGRRKLRGRKLRRQGLRTLVLGIGAALAAVSLPAAKPLTAGERPVPVPALSPISQVAQIPVEVEAGDEVRPALLQADSVTYDDSARVVTAEGNVEVARGERILHADRLIYDVDGDIIRAEGNVRLFEPTGEILYAESIELTGDLLEGAVRSFGMLLTDRSRLAAASAVRVDGSRTEMRSVVFSPCDQCATGLGGAPAWQIRADRVIHDQEDQILRYRDASLEIFGLPVLYTPYFEHPDPTLDRKSGFLAPTFGSSSELGAQFQIPYHYVIDEHRDFTFEPIFTSEQGPVLGGEYRQRTRSGRYSIAGSATLADRGVGPNKDRNAFRGHIDTQGDFAIDRNWRWGFDAQRTTDDTYLRIYNFDRDRFLTSQAFVEGFHGRNYTAARAMSFQGMRELDSDSELPIVLPELTYSAMSEPGQMLGGHTFVDAGILALSRVDGRNSRRLSSSVGWTRAHTDALGGISELTTVLHADGYSVSGADLVGNRVNPPPGEMRDDDFAGRLFPQMALSYRYPMHRTSFLGREVLEPRVQVVVGPNGGNPGEIPNEDSLDFEFDDTNLFRLNRFPGRDRISSGQRVDYGLSYSVFSDGFGYVGAFLGQSFRISSDESVPRAAGTDGSFSDLVGRLDFSPIPFVDASYRFRFDQDDFSSRRNELNLGLGPPALRLNLDYTALDDDESFLVEDPGEREELFVQLNTRFARDWSAEVSHRRDLQAGNSLLTRLGLTWHCDCMLVNIQAERRFFEDRDLDPEFRVMVRVGLRHLGEFVTD